MKDSRDVFFTFKGVNNLLDQYQIERVEGHYVHFENGVLGSFSRS